MDQEVSGGQARLRLQFAAVGLALAAILGLAGLFIWQVQGSSDARRRLAARADEQASAASDVLDLLQDAENGQRGFLLTMSEDYLAPFLAARARRDALLRRLVEVTSEVPASRDEAALLRELTLRKFGELERSIALARTSGRDAAIAVMRTDEGKFVMDAARDHVTWIGAAATRERDQTVLQLRQREREAAISALIVTAIGLSLLGGTVAALLLGRARILRIGAELDLERGRLTGAIANLPDGVAVFDARNRLLLWNQRFFETTGLPAELGALGVSWRGFSEHAAAWPGAPLAAERPGSAATSLEAPLDDRTLELWRCPMPDGGQMLVVGDITRRTRAEEIARQASKMEALGQLTGGVAHDFNNLLQVVSANLELIGLRLSAEDPGRARLTAAMAAIERASRLTRHLLAFARRQPLAPEVLDPARLLRAMDDMLRRTLGQGIELEFVMGSGVWAVRADPAQLENAVLNLAINARDAMRDGGKLTIEAANASLDMEYAQANAEVSPGQYVVIAIIDTGCGMTREQMSRAMEPFYTTKAEGYGTGLGLPMVFGFAKQSSGHFRLDSEPGHGTTARLYLPRSTASPPAEPVRADSAMAATANGELVLVVEDDPNVRAAGQLALQGLGYRTVACENTATALAKLRGGLRPDLLFSDVVMPGQPSAREMAAEAKRLVPGLAVLFTSGNTENSIVQNGQLDPGVMLVSKPWRTVDLARQLRMALDRAARAPSEQPAMRILLVEDDVLVRMSTADLLADLGHVVLEAGNGAEARRLFADAPDLVITDLGLPDVDGLELAAEFRAGSPRVPIIIASGKAAETDPSYLWLRKPYDAAALQRALSRALRPG